jgi:hypothetical protein
LAILTKRNWRKLRKQDLPATAFFAVAIVAAAMLIGPLWNYTQYYSALWNFSYNIPGITVSTSQLSAQTAQINFTVIGTNPTRYSGLQVGSVNCIISYYGSLHLGSAGPTNWWELTTVYSTKRLAIGPNSNVTIFFEITIDPSSAPPGQFDAFQQFINYLTSQVPGGQVQWSLSCNLGLDSFMGISVVSSSFAPITPLD